MGLAPEPGVGGGTSKDGCLGSLSTGRGAGEPSGGTDETGMAGADVATGDFAEPAGRGAVWSGADGRANTAAGLPLRPEDSRGPGRAVVFPLASGAEAAWDLNDSMVPQKQSRRAAERA